MSEVEERPQIPQAMNMPMSKWDAQNTLLYLNGHKLVCNEITQLDILHTPEYLDSTTYVQTKVCTIPRPTHHPYTYHTCVWHPNVLILWA